MANRAVAKAHESRGITGMSVKTQPTPRSTNSSRGTNSGAGRTVSSTASTMGFSGGKSGKGKAAFKKV